LFELEYPRVTRREVDISDCGFLPLTALLAKKEAFETWSQFVLDHLSVQ
jgi:hypothetical protein